MIKGFDVNVKTDRDKYDLPLESEVGSTLLQDNSGQKNKNSHYRRTTFQITIFFWSTL